MKLIFMHSFSQLTHFSLIILANILNILLLFSLITSSTAILSRLDKTLLITFTKLINNIYSKISVTFLMTDYFLVLLLLMFFFSIICFDCSIIDSLISLLSICQTLSFFQLLCLLPTSLLITFSDFCHPLHLLQPPHFYLASKILTK